MVYVHAPFCHAKCPYCDFVSFAKKNINSDEYTNLIGKELLIRTEEIKNLKFEDFPTIYFGGGTPTLFNEEFFVKTIETIKDIFGEEIEDIIEITVEANPESCEFNKLRNLKFAGANRISLGVQSFCDNELQKLGRTHSAKKAIKTLGIIKNAGFENVSIDLIYGIPGQTLESWERTLEQASNSNVQHISIYSLTISGSSNWDYKKQGSLLEDDLVADMYEQACRLLLASGFHQYEISNFAKKGFKCLHNLNCWSGGDYVGVGVGAHSKNGNTRKWNIADYNGYKSCLKNGKLPIGGLEVLNKNSLYIEKLILGLRLNDGVYAPKFNAKVKDLMEFGMLEVENNHLKLTDRSRFISNEIFSELLLLN